MNKLQIQELISAITIAKVKEIKKHEDADRLQILQIDAGNVASDLADEETGLIQIVTAASNFTEGDLVPFLSPGNVVPGWLFKEGQEIKLESRKMRGEISHGMILAEDEIGMGEDHEGILVINKKFNIEDEVVGESLSEILTDDSWKAIYNFAGVVEITQEMQNKIDFITRDLQEVVGDEDLPKILAERPLKIYWGTAPTGKPHLAYIVPILKIADFLKAGSEATILFADMHAFLDNMKSSWELLKARTAFYEFLIKEMLSLVQVPIDKLKFIKGTDYQLSEKYNLDMYKMSSLASVRDAKKAGAEVVKQSDSPLMSSMLYPILQALDEEYLDVDAQLGGVDQRKIFMFAREFLPKIGYKKRVHFMNPLIPGLGKSGKMSSSEPNSKIDFDDTEEIIKQKIAKSFSIDKEVEGNGLLSVARYIIFKILEFNNEQFVIEREDKWGGNITYANYDELEKDFAEGNLSSVDLKPAIAREIIRIIKPLQEKLNNQTELIVQAYPKN